MLVHLIILINSLLRILQVVLKDLKDHLRHAKKIGECIQVSDIYLRMCYVYIEQVLIHMSTKQSLELIIT